jgi:hypothetical protein
MGSCATRDGPAAFHDSHAPQEDAEPQPTYHTGGTPRQPSLLHAPLRPLQVDTEPSIRANTTVLLGNIAGHLGAATARRILLNAFTRALRDIFPPSRVAAAKALMATAAYYPPTEVAARVVPALVPLLLDSQPDVRAAALKVRAPFWGTLSRCRSRRVTSVAVSQQ